MAGNDAVVGVNVIGGVSQNFTMGLARTEAHLNNVANAGKNAASAFRQLSLAGGFAEGALFGAVNKYAAFAKTTAEFEERMARAAALMGPANANLARMRDTVMTMSGMEHGPNALADAFLELSRAGIENGQALRDMKTVADLATVAQIGLGEAANSTATIMLAWAGPLDTSTKLLNQLANVANATQFSIKGLMAQMRHASPSSIQFGESFRDMLASLSMLAPVVGTVGAGRVHAQMRQVIASPKAVAAMSKILGRDPTKEFGRGDVLGPLTDLAANLQKKHGIVAGAQKAKEMFSSLGIRGMSGYFRAMERGVTGPDGRILYGREALQHYRNMADTGVGLAPGADLIRESPGMVMQRLKVDWEKFIIGIGKPFLDLLVDLEKPLQSILKAGQAFGNSGWAKLGIAISALPIVGAAMGVIRAIGGRTSASLGSLFGIGGAGLGPVTPGTMVPLSAAQRWHAYRTGNVPAGFDKESRMYKYSPSAGYNSPIAGNFFGMAGDTLGRMFPDMQGPSSYFSDPKRNPRVRSELAHIERLRAAQSSRLLRHTANIEYHQGEFDKARAAGQHSKASSIGSIIAGAEKKESLAQGRYSRVIGRLQTSSTSPRGGFSAGNIAGYALSSIGSFASGLVTTLGPLAAFAGLTIAAAQAMEQEQDIKDKQARNRTELTSFVEGLGAASQWIQAQTGGGSKWARTPEFTALIGKDRRLAEFMASVIEDADEKGTKNFSQGRLATVFSQRLQGAITNINQLGKDYGLDPAMQGDVGQKLYLAKYLADRAAGGTAIFTGGIGRKTYTGLDNPDMDPEARARLMSGQVNYFAGSSVGRHFGFGAPGVGLGSSERLQEHLRKTLALGETEREIERRKKLQAMYSADVFNMDDYWENIQKVAATNGSAASSSHWFERTFGTASEDVDLVRKANALRSEVNTSQAMLTPADLASMATSSIDMMSMTLAGRLGGGSSLKDIHAAIKDMSAEVQAAINVAIVTNYANMLSNTGQHDQGNVGLHAMLEALKMQLAATGGKP